VYKNVKMCYSKKQRRGKWPNMGKGNLLGPLNSHFEALWRGPKSRFQLWPRTFLVISVLKFFFFPFILQKLLKKLTYSREFKKMIFYCKTGNNFKIVCSFAFQDLKFMTICVVYTTVWVIYVFMTGRTQIWYYTDKLILPIIIEINNI